MTFALGCMRLSTAADRDEARGLAVLLAALDAGVTLLDTADSYGLDDPDRGHNERLIADARRARPTLAVRVATKGGMARPGGRWIPDGRAGQLDATARASRERLGTIELYLLHVIDPAVPLATSVRALARLRTDGVVGALGLCNVNRAQVEAAQAIAPLAAIQIALSPLRADALRSGLVAWARARGLEVLAHRPLGGPDGAARLARDRTMTEHAARLGATPATLALAWLRHHGAVPLPGATQLDTARAAAQAVALDDEAIAALDRRFLDRAPPTTIAMPRRDVEVVVVMGIPGAGKSTAIASLVADGYTRLNRDERGGTLSGLARVLDDALSEGATRVVLDNTYPTRAQRADVIAAAHRHGATVRCVWLDTALGDAQVNAATRAYARLGHLPEPDELKRSKDPAVLPPAALFRWQRELEPPDLDEGFTDVERRAFVRTPRVAGAPALIVELAEVIWRGRPIDASAAVLVPESIAALRAWRDAGWRLAATAWSPDTTDAVRAALSATVDAALGAPLPIAWCRHGAGPPVCWCRKPLPGLGVALAQQLDLDLAASWHVGTGAADRGFAERLGLRYVEVSAWLAIDPPPPR